jgi:hypothetical protein
MNLLNLGLGLLLLGAGRRLYWLFVGVVGFSAGLLVTMYFLEDRPLLALFVSIAAGLLGAVLAIFLQRVLVGIAGFLVSGFLAVNLLAQFGVELGSFSWVPFVFAGIVGGVFLSLMFDWALIVLSSLAGALLVIREINLDPLVNVFLLFLLAGIGAAIQGYIDPPASAD